MGLYKEYAIEHIDEQHFCTMINHRETKGMMIDHHWHDYVEILYILEGEAAQTVDDVQLTLTVGDIIIIEPGAVHATTALSDNCYIAVILSMPENIHHCLGQFKGSYLKSPYQYEHEIKQIFVKINTEYKSKLSGYDSIITGCVYEFLGYLSRNRLLISKDNNTESNQMKLAFDYIDENIDKPLHLKDISSIIGYSPEYFSKLFKKISGQSFKAYVDHVKMMKAKRLIIFEGLSVTDTAYKVGYDDISSFCRAFKRINGYPPSSLVAQK